MFIAQKLREENIAQYLLYMWQVEDVLRAFGLDGEKIGEAYLSRFDDWSEKQKAEALRWYEELAEMMRSEGIKERGHLQISKNVLINLAELHQSLLDSQKFPYYRAAYQEALPLIVELRAKQSDETDELESCFTLLYGLMVLRMQRREISQETEEAARKIFTFLGMLSDYYHKNRQQALEF